MSEKDSLLLPANKFPFHKNCQKLFFEHMGGNVLKKIHQNLLKFPSLFSILLESYPKNNFFQNNYPILQT